MSSANGMGGGMNYGGPSGQGYGTTSNWMPYSNNFNKSAAEFGRAGDVYGQAAAGQTGAMGSAFQGLNFNPQQVQFQGYNPHMIDPSQMNNQFGYKPAQMSGASYDPSANVQGGQYDSRQLSNTNLDPYMNPFTQNVTDVAVDDINRSRQMIGNQQDAMAQSVGGFGGSRSALMQTENDRNAMDQVGRTSAQLNQANFANAQNMAMGDIGNENQASQYNLGLDMQSQLANQGAMNQAGQFNAGNQQQANAANMGAQNQASQFGQQLNSQNQMTGMLANQGAANQAGQYNSGQNLAAQQMNQNANNQANAQRMQQQQILGNLSNAGFGMGNTINGQLGQQGAQQQQMMQQLINASKGQFNNFTGMPQQQQQQLSQLLGSMPGGGGSQTQSNNPGAMDYATMAMSLFSMFSDERLKDDVHLMGKYPGTDHNLYSWTWSQEALNADLRLGPAIGVIAQEVMESQPEAVTESPEGYLKVNYGGLH